MILFGRSDSLRYGGVFKPDGYWAMWDSHSVLKSENGVFVNLGGGAGGPEHALTGAAVEGLLAAPGSP